MLMCCLMKKIKKRFIDRSKKKDANTENRNLFQQIRKKRDLNVLTKS